MSSSRRRSARPDPARRRLGMNLEALETRQLLTQSSYLSMNGYPTQNFLTETPPGATPAITIAHPIGTNPATVATYQNQGKLLTGEDRQGNRWQLKLTGPGTIIVTDTTPNDGVLDDDINAITLVGTDPLKSSLHGEVEESARAPTSYTQLPTLGTVNFNRLISQNGIKAIVLNGFQLTDTITPPGSDQLSAAETGLNQTTGIQIHGSIQTLDFEGIDGRFPASFNPQPIVISIGNPTTPLTVAASIRIDHIYNTSYDDTAFGSGGTQTIPTGPLTTPSITLFVNGAVKSFNVVSITQEADFSTLNAAVNGSFLVVPTELIPSDSASLEYQFPIVGTTGRTAVQAKSIGSLKVNGKATNVSFSKSAQPFQNSLTGLDSLGSAQFGGTTDAVAIDSKGSIGSLTFAKGVGNPTGVSANSIYYGTPADQYGYAATPGKVAVQVVTEKNIGKLKVAPNNQFLQVSQDPTQIQSGINGYTTYVNQPGTAIQSSLIAAGGSIGSTHIVGNQLNSEIKSGYNYYAAVGGAEPVSGKSSIGPATIRGDLVDSVISATYRTNDGVYGNGNDTAGDGTITGTFAGNVVQTATGKTVLGNSGSGIYSRFTNTHPRPKSLTVKAAAVKAASVKKK